MSDSFHLPELCEICMAKDDEDIYIVFNALYRIIIGEVFQGNQENGTEEQIHNQNSVHITQPTQKDFQSTQEKLQNFRNTASQQTLKEIINSAKFDLLLREIFKSKYSRVQDANCKHEELAK